jgi:hypothetical protein
MVFYLQSTILYLFSPALRGQQVHHIIAEGLADEEVLSAFQFQW